jgi:hypothetical protein
MVANFLYCGNWGAAGYFFKVIQKRYPRERARGSNKIHTKIKQLVLY